MIGVINRVREDIEYWSLVIDKFSPGSSQLKWR